jgi:hypothetical protein
MNDRNKTTITHDDAIPLVQASLVFDTAEPLRAVRTEYVVIDEFFHNNNSNLSLESTNSVNTSVASTAHSVDPLDSNLNYHHPHDYHHHYQPEEAFGPSNVLSSMVEQSKTCGAWADGIVLGFLLGAGPSLSMAFGFGAAYCSQQEEGVAGDVARAVGDVALLSHQKFVEVNEKHGLVNSAANSTVAFTRKCMVAVRGYVGSIFSASDKKSRNPTRQVNTQHAKTT